MLKKFITVVSLSALAIAAPASAAPSKSSGQKLQEKGQAQIPVCTRKIGTAAIVEPDNNWWQPLGLGAPEAVIKLFVMKSGCFGLVDRGKGLASRAVERALAEDGELQRGSNIGRRQVKAADYFIVPDIVSKNADSGGMGVAGALGGFLGGRTFGGLLGGLKVSKKEANVLLTVVNARTTEQEVMTEGYARKSDVGFGGGGGGFFGGGFAAAGASSYENTDIGKVLVLAYLDAYTKMVTQLGGLPVNASAAAPRAE